MRPWGWIWLAVASVSAVAALLIGLLDRETTSLGQLLAVENLGGLLRYGGSKFVVLATCLVVVRLALSSGGGRRHPASSKPQAGNGSGARLCAFNVVLLRPWRWPGCLEVICLVDSSVVCFASGY
jgi:hypothetical protein